MIRQVILSAAAVLSSTQAKAAVLSGGVAASAAAISSADPLPWLVSALGALVVLTKFPAVSKPSGVGNVVISVLLGGLGCEFVSLHIEQLSGLAPGPLLAAFVLSCAWPVAVRVVQQLWPSVLQLWPAVLQVWLAVLRRWAKKIGGG
jgi:hypothetical protein